MGSEASIAVCSRDAVVHRLVLMAHVIDVERSCEFYRLFGFLQRNILREPSGAAYWAWMETKQASIMLARASGPVDAGVQAVLFYLYTNDLALLREHLLACGLHDAGPFHGAAMGGGARGAESTITYPPYMQEGEMRVHDPDGYVLLVGQAG